MSKTDIEHFRDWESHNFGFGYGSGEEHVIPALRRFFELCNGGAGYSYDYTILERELTPTVAWLLINILAGHRADVIEYGTSPRYAWLDHKHGVRLKEFMLSKTNDELIKIVTAYNEDYYHCTPDYCNCDDVICHNPFWKELPNRKSTQGLKP